VAVVRCGGDVVIDGRYQREKNEKGGRQQYYRGLVKVKPNLG
jgi:hypothetical protein